MCRVAVPGFEEVGPEGVLRNFDVVYYASPDPVTGQSREVPYTTCYVELDGSKGATFWHELRETDISKSPRHPRPGRLPKKTANARVRRATSNISRLSKADRALPKPGSRLATPDAGRQTPDAFVVNGTFALPYNYFAGRVGSRWLVALRDEQKIYGVRHPKTGKV